MYQRADHPAATIHFQITRRPDRGRANVEGEDGIITRRLADDSREILRMDRLAARRALGERVESIPRLLVMGDRAIEMPAVGLGLEQRQQRLNGEIDVADQAEVDLAAPAEIVRPDSDLRDLAVGRKELLVGKVGAE